MPKSIPAVTKYSHREPVAGTSSGTIRTNSQDLVKSTKETNKSDLKDLSLLAFKRELAGWSPDQG
jgi:hypothetical protein